RVRRILLTHNYNRCFSYLTDFFKTLSFSIDTVFLFFSHSHSTIIIAWPGWQKNGLILFSSNKQIALMMAEMTAYKILKATCKKKKDAMPYHHRLTHQSPAAFRQNLRNIRKADEAAQTKRASSLTSRIRDQHKNNSRLY
ncbi:hypothetical protein KDK47_05695, partial [Streptococcus equi subsp. zooepidemicus]